MLKSILEISKELGISKNTAYKYLKAHNEKPAKVGKNGIQMFNEDTQKRISEAFNKHLNGNTNSDQKAIIEVYKAQIEQLTKQVQSDQEQLAKMQTLLDQEQRLSLERNKLLQMPKEEKEAQDETSDKKPGFFTRLFKG